MKVSVIIPTYNRPQFLRQAIDSFMSQDYEDKELIVVNDGGSIPEVPEGVTLYNLEHGNQSTTQNYGIEKATGELVCTLDDDDLFYDETSLSQRVNLFESNPDLEVIWTSAQDIWENGSFKADWNAILDQDIWMQDRIFINSMMWRKSIKDKIGYWFDEELTSNEDWDFKIRCLEECTCKGFDIFTVKHRVHPSMRSNEHRGSGELGRNEALFKAKLKAKYDK